MVKFNVHSFKKVQEQQANYKGIKKQHAQKSRSPKSSEWIRIAGESLDVLPRIWISKQVDVEGNEIDYLVQADPDTTKHFDELVSFLGPETFFFRNQRTRFSLSLAGFGQKTFPSSPT